MNRYAVIAGKLPREIVLLRSLPCIWGRCTFCDYILDNTTDLNEIRSVASRELAKVTGRYSRLEMINSGSVQELPIDVRRAVRELLHDKGIRDFICESYWAYQPSFAETLAFFGVPTRLKIGIETFDDHLRNDVLGKNIRFESPADVARFTDTICLLVGFKGQTRDLVRRDMDILLTQFRFGCVNLFTPNSRSEGLLDADIQAWFREEYAWLAEHPTIEVLWENTDFGVGG
ncbi:MAG: radical SAM protein [Phycisphaerae bacterium]|nr:radical SAM protein [Phycisphaerae bacterium]